MEPTGVGLMVESQEAGQPLKEGPKPQNTGETVLLWAGAESWWGSAVGVGLDCRTWDCYPTARLPDINHQVGKAIIFAQAGDPLVPFSLPAGYVKTRGQDPASSHVLKTYSELMFTVPRRDVTRNSRARHPCKEPACAAHGSLHNRPQHGCWAPTQRASLPGVSLSFST